MKCKKADIFNFMIAVLWGLLATGCMVNPVRIGLTSEISGRNAVVGVHGRNAALLAQDEINAAGGINGRPLEIMVADGHGTPEGTLEADQQLIKQGALLLTGHFTSLEVNGAWDYIEKNNIILFSATAASPKFQGLKDHFFRLVPVNVVHAHYLADYAYTTLGLRRAVGIIDRDNLAYSNSFKDGFKERFVQLGGEFAAEVRFSSLANENIRPLLEELRTHSPDVIFFAVTSMNAALISQQIALMDWPVQKVSADWAYTEELLKVGGKTVDGMILVSPFNYDCQTEAFLNFKRKFSDIYGQDPSFVAVISYETMMELARVLRLTGGTTEGLADELAKPRVINGLCDTIRTDEYGDVLRTMYLIEVKHGQFVEIERLEP
ncbi:MAG TPA: ABC transporter substrate-binding protein [Anaerolineaceae bacterium]|nr:ABC transporter substrate-binding protein [Anaerolineaceae bacterium]HPN50955.1 ABC transporter substrate-binding protein [Anaerolineaceae bacterium]